MPIDDYTSEQWLDLVNRGKLAPSTYKRRFPEEAQQIPNADYVSGDQMAEAAPMQPQTGDEIMSQNAPPQRPPPREDGLVSRDELALPGAAQQPQAPAPGMGMDFSGSMQRQVPVDSGAINSGYDLQELGLMQQAQIGREQAAKEAGYLNEMAKQKRDAAIQQEQDAQKRQDELNKKFVDIDTQIQNVTAQRISREDARKSFWAEKTTGEKILAGIALALGAVGAARTGKNMAAEYINSAIDKDVEIQAKNIENKKDALNTKKSLLSQFISAGHDLNTAKYAAKIAGIDSAIYDIKANSSRYAGQETAAKAVQTIGQLNVQKAMLMDKLSASVAGDMDAKEMRERYIPEYGVAQYGKVEDVSKLREYLNNVVPAKDKVERLLEISNIPGASASLDLRTEAQSISKLLQGLLREDIVGPGTVQENERQIMREIIADPTKMFSLSRANKVALNTLLKSLNTNIAQKLKSVGLQSKEDRLGIKNANAYK